MGRTHVQVECPWGSTSQKNYPGAENSCVRNLPVKLFNAQCLNCALSNIEIVQCSIFMSCIVNKSNVQYLNVHCRIVQCAIWNCTLSNYQFIGFLFAFVL